MTSKLKVTFEITFTRLDTLTLIMQHLHKLDDLGLLTVKLDYYNASKRDPASLTAYKSDERDHTAARNAKRNRDLLGLGNKKTH